MADVTPSYRAAPDRAFADRLEAELVARLSAAPAAGDLPAPRGPVGCGARTVDLRVDDGSRGSSRRPIAAIVGVAAALVVVLVLVAVRGADPPVPIEVTPSTVPTPSTTPLTSPSTSTSSVPQTTPAPPPTEPVGVGDDPFTGTWVAIDTDGSWQTMEVTPDGDGFRIEIRDDRASVCGGSPSTLIGAGTSEGDVMLLVPGSTYTCDDGATPAVSSGPPLEERLADLAFVHAADVDELQDGFGVVWNRAGTASAAGSGAMWPQRDLEEVRVAQRRADAGDADVAWQVDPDLAWWEVSGAHGDPGRSEVVARFLRERLGWEEFRGGAFQPWAGSGEGTIDNHVFIRCAVGDSNVLYPDHPVAGECAPTIDAQRYEAVRLSVVQPDRVGATGLWVVARWTLIESAVQAVPPSDTEATELLDAFLRARVVGSDVDRYLADGTRLPLVSATAAGSPFERSEIVTIEGPVWPTGERHAQLRLVADGGGTVVSQWVTIARDEDGSLVVLYSPDRGPEPATTENGEPAAEPYDVADGRVTFAAARPWHHSPAGWEHSGSATTLWRDDVGDERLLIGVDVAPIGPACEAGPVAVDAESLIDALRLDPALAVSETSAASLGNRPALVVDVTVAAGAGRCDPASSLVLFHGEGSSPFMIQGGERVRLYVADGDGEVIVAAVTAPDVRFADVVAAAAPVVASIRPVDP